MGADRRTSEVGGERDEPACGHGLSTHPDVMSRCGV